MTDNFLAAKDNPLRLERSTTLPYSFESGTWDDHLNRLEGLNFRAAIVGRYGSGKSTLLNMLSNRLDAIAKPNFLITIPNRQDLHRKHVSEAMEQSRLGNILLVDGIERLSFFQKRTLLSPNRIPNGLVVVVHSACKLPTWVHCKTSKSQLRKLLSQLSIDHEPVIRDAEEAFERLDGNMRSVLRELYDRFASGNYSMLSL